MTNRIRKSLGNESAIKGRVFIVGCPRSGTTLLQSLLAAHPEVISFPESHFFSSLVIQKWSKLLGIGSPQAQEKTEQLISCFGERYSHLNSFPRTWSLRNNVSFFVNCLDFISADQNKKHWLEKSPQHLSQIHFIEKLVPKSKFIHIIRNGPDVVASLYDVACKYPKQWDGPWSIEKCTNWWTRSVKASLNYSQRENHFLIRYEKIITKTDASLMEICDFLGIPFFEEMVDGHKNASQKLIRKGEAWKASTAKEIRDSSREKFFKIFNAEQREYIFQILANSNCSQYVNLDANL